MFSNFCNIVIYGNPVSENEIESNDKSMLWSNIEEYSDNTNLSKESKFEQEFVPMAGTDKSI